MKKKQPVYDDTFRKEAVKLSMESGKKVGQIAQDLAIAQSTLVSWRKRLMDCETTRSSANYEKVLLENRQLRKAIETAEMERDILKKAVAFFAKEGPK